jgi:hypothetical protein
MLRLEGAVVHINNTDNLVVSYAGLTRILPLTHAVAETFRAVAREVEEEAEQIQARARKTANARETYRSMAAGNGG